MVPGASKTHAARGHDVPADYDALPGEMKPRRGRSAATTALISVPAADCALPTEMKSRRGRAADAPVSDCGFPGVGKCISARGRRFAPAVLNVPVAPVAPDVPAAVADVSDAAVLSTHNACAVQHRNVSVDADNTSAQPSTKSITPLTDREPCVYCASKGRCKKHCVTKRRRLPKVATTKSSGGSREPIDA